MNQNTSEHTCRTADCGCTGTKAACYCSSELRAGIGASFDPSTLVNRIAELTAKGIDPKTSTQMLRNALNRLIDERVTARLRERVEVTAGAPKKTRGQEIAAKLVGPVVEDPMGGVAIYPSPGYVPLVLAPRDYGNENTIVSAQFHVAAAIDNAIAEEREACAVAATYNATRCDSDLHPEYGRGRSDALRDALEGIRNRK